MEFEHCLGETWKNRRLLHRSKNLHLHHFISMFKFDELKKYTARI